MCIPLRNRFETIQNNDSENIVSNNELVENEATPGFHSENRDCALTMFPKCLIFIYMAILNNVVLPNLDKSCYYGTRNLVLLCLVIILFLSFRRLNDTLSTVLNMAPGDLRRIISCSPYFMRFILWIKPKNIMIRNVLQGMLFVGFVAQVVVGMGLLARLFKKYVWVFTWNPTRISEVKHIFLKKFYE